MNVAIPSEVTAGWQRALEDWADPSRHDALLGLAAKHQQFAWLAGKYRAAAWSNPSDGIAPVRLLRVQRAAAIVTFAQRAPRKEPAPRVLKGAMAILVGAALATLLGLHVTEHRVQQEAQPQVSRHP